jgi:2-polyprenyl-3-methyl-5-hydroxy-6-metoxy-1,4-benzoquinol methylase
VLGIEEWHQNSLMYDVITCLNVLDRCDYPMTMLKDMVRVVKQDGCIIIAVVLPFSPYVEKGKYDSSKNIWSGNIHVIPAELCQILSGH